MRKLSALLLAAMLALPAFAIDRPFPANILRGKFTPGYYPDIMLDGKPRQLSPSARIFNQDNRIEMPAAVRGSDIVVNYTVDGMGYIDRIWILTDDEAAQKVPVAK
ncbi:hypothetical protein HH213_06055 [Duganella dendranthematis]|uniref:Uncharacterized protein n=1 Tax=Duganella dendranthematis TaxID=2728021 RepID=A0ABX6M627_9BURK|nr:hypothetical protein [Duganella dendranthematis]QJD89705.1 hypothetical protein HH213_06055 [Duganella dendranthematis]